jgi:hypothetical protein
MMELRLEHDEETEWGSSSQLWQHFYQLGCLFASAHDMGMGLTYLIDAFLIRGGEEEGADLEWIDFFRRQFAIYLMGKGRLSCSICEGDMIHDLLRDEYERIKVELEESELPFATEHLARWFGTLELDFPWMGEEKAPHRAFG